MSFTLHLVYLSSIALSSAATIGHSTPKSSLGYPPDIKGFDHVAYFAQHGVVKPKELPPLKSPQAQDSFKYTEHDLAHYPVLEEMLQKINKGEDISARYNETEFKLRSEGARHEQTFGEDSWPMFGGHPKREADIEESDIGRRHSLIKRADGGVNRCLGCMSLCLIQHLFDPTTYLWSQSEKVQHCLGDCQARGACNANDRAQYGQHFDHGDPPDPPDMANNFPGTYVYRNWGSVPYN